MSIIMDLLKLAADVPGTGTEPKLPNPSTSTHTGTQVGEGLAMMNTKPQSTITANLNNNLGSPSMMTGSSMHPLPAVGGTSIPAIPAWASASTTSPQSDPGSGIFIGGKKINMNPQSGQPDVNAQAAAAGRAVGQPTNAAEMQQLAQAPGGIPRSQASAPAFGGAFNPQAMTASISTAEENAIQPPTSAQQSIQQSPMAQKILQSQEPQQSWSGRGGPTNEQMQSIMNSELQGLKDDRITSPFTQPAATQYFQPYNLGRRAQQMTGR